MSTRERIEQIVANLRASSASIRCQELAEILSSLGFNVRDGARPGHKVLVHHGMAAFTSAGYTCGHGRNPEIKPVYVKKVARLIEQYKDDLVKCLGE